MFYYFHICPTSAFHTENIEFSNFLLKFFTAELKLKYSGDSDDMLSDLLSIGNFCFFTDFWNVMKYIFLLMFPKKDTLYQK